MLKNAFGRGLFLLYIVTALTACSKYQKILKSTDMNAKYDAALKYYNDHEYMRAQPLFEELLSAFRGSMKAEDVYYYYAYCHYATGDYLMAAHHFNNFLNSFPRSPKAEEIQYMYAYCIYLQTPISSLDQEYSRKAINEFQLFIDRYPESERVAQCNELIDKLRTKLERKAFDIAYLYYKTRDYKAAVVALKNVAKEYPGSEYEEETYFLVVKSSYLYASNSTERRKLERYKDALTEYRNFASRFPNSKFMKEAKSLEESIRKSMAEVKESKPETKPNNKV